MAILWVERDASLSGPQQIFPWCHPVLSPDTTNASRVCNCCFFVCPTLEPTCCPAGFVLLLYDPPWDIIKAITVTSLLSGWVCVTAVWPTLEREAVIVANLLSCWVCITALWPTLEHEAVIVADPLSCWVCVTAVWPTLEHEAVTVTKCFFAWFVFVMCDLQEAVILVFVFSHACYHLCPCQVLSHFQWHCLIVSWAQHF